MSMETDRIEADLNQSRHRLNDTLEQLGSKLSPGQMVDEALGLLQGQAGEFAAKLGRQVRDNPMPVLLIGAGVALMMVKQHGNSSSRASLSAEDWHSERRYRSIEEARWANPRQPNESDHDYDHRIHQAYASALDLKQKADEAVHAFKERVSKTVAGVQQAATAARERLGQTFSDAAHFAEHQTERLGEKAAAAKHRAEDLYEENPLAAGAIALAVGALIGSAAPLSQAERQALRGVADKAADAGANLAERGARLVEDRADALH